MKDAGYSVAIVGATGLVGEQILELLAERGVPVRALQLYASLRTAGDEMRRGRLSARVEPLDAARFEDTDIVFFAANEQVSAAWVPRASDAGAVAIDLSQLYAEDQEVPLVVPEVNAASLAHYDARRVIASPDAAAIAMSIVLKPLQEVSGLKRVVAATLESVSAAGRAGIEELQQQTVELMSGRSVDPTLFPHRIAFNVVPQIGEFLAGGASRDEQLTVRCLRRLLDEPALAIGMTRVRTPLFYGAAIALNVESVEPLTADMARAALRSAPGVLLHDDAPGGTYPTAVDAVGQDAIGVARLRNDDTGTLLDLWLVFDNVRKGSAANAVQIAELLIRDYL